MLAAMQMKDERDWYEYGWIAEAAEAFSDAADTGRFTRLADAGAHGRVDPVRGQHERDRAEDPEIDLHEHGHGFFSPRSST